MMPVAYRTTDVTVRVSRAPRRSLRKAVTASERGCLSTQSKAGCNANTRLVPARTNVEPNCAFSCGFGIVTDGPPTLVPSSRCSVKLSIVRSSAPAVTIRLSDVLKTKPGQSSPPDGVSLTKLGESTNSERNGDGV